MLYASGFCLLLVYDVVYKMYDDRESYRLVCTYEGRGGGVGKRGCVRMEELVVNRVSVVCVCVCAK